MSKVSKEKSAALGQDILSHLKGCTATVENIKALLDQGADIEQCDYNRNTPLLWIAFEGNLDLIKLFLDYGANVNAENIYHNRPLTCAMAYDDTTFLKMLLKRDDVDLDFADSGGVTIWEKIHGMYKNTEVARLITDYPKMRDARVKKRVLDKMEKGVNKNTLKPKKAIFKKP